MGFSNLFKKKKPSVTQNNPMDNPYHEAICDTITVQADSTEQEVVFRWIKNSSAAIKGAQAIFEYHGEKIPITVSAPSAGTFSVGVSIGLDKIMMPRFQEELSRLKETDEVSAKAQLSYSADFGTAILYRRSDAEIKKGDLAKWRSLLEGNFQVLIDDLVAVMPFIMHIYGE